CKYKFDEPTTGMAGDEGTPTGLADLVCGEGKGPITIKNIECEVTVSGGAPNTNLAHILYHNVETTKEPLKRHIKATITVEGITYTAKKGCPNQPNNSKTRSDGKYIETLTVTAVNASEESVDTFVGSTSLAGHFYTTGATEMKGSGADSLEVSVGESKLG